MTSSTGPGRPGPVVERRVLRDGVYEAVLERLLENRLTPGDALSIDGLARELGVSPTPVREALVQLEHTGLITRTALKGYRVSPPLSAARTRELGIARAVVEVAAIRLAVPVGADVLAALTQSHDQHGLAADLVLRSFEPLDGGVHGTQQDVDWSVLSRYYAADWDFHLILLGAAGNRYLLEMAQGLAPHVHRLRQSVQQGRLDVEQAHEEHAAVVRAVRGGDPDAAADALERHLRGGGRTLGRRELTSPPGPPADVVSGEPLRSPGMHGTVLSVDPIGSTI